MIYRVTYRRQATGEILWRREMTANEYAGWVVREQDELEAALTPGADRRTEVRQAAPGECEPLD